MRILLTGGAGFIGRHLATALLNRNDTVFIYDNFASADPRYMRELSDRVTLYKGGVDDKEAVEQAVEQSKPEVIMHLGAVASAAQALAQPAMTARVNLEGTINILEASRIYGVKRCLSLSTEETYGPIRYEPIDESHPQNPASIYGITKLAAERFCVFYRNYYEVDVASVRAGWTYGPGYPRVRLEAKIIRDALQGLETVIEKGGDHRVDYIWVGDFVKGMLGLADAEKLKYHAYNIGSGTGRSMFEVLETIRHLLPDIRVKLGPGLVDYVPGYEQPQKGALDIARMNYEVGYLPDVSFEDGLARYIEYLRNSETLI